MQLTVDLEKAVFSTFGLLWIRAYPLERHLWVDPVMVFVPGKNCGREERRWWFLVNILPATAIVDRYQTFGVNCWLHRPTPRNMDLSEFTSNYAHLGDDELLCLWADRNTLLPEAAMALDSELQRRGLNKQKAPRVKKRFDALAAREGKGPLANQVAAARYERNMRHFVGWEEPEFYSPYGRRDIRRLFASIRHRYRVWKGFRDHTGHWPVFSIWFHFLSWLAVLGLTVSAFVWVGGRNWGSNWIMVLVAGCALVLLGARELGARLMRKLDWKRYGT